MNRWALTLVVPGAALALFGAACTHTTDAGAAARLVAQSSPTADVPSTGASAGPLDARAAVQRALPFLGRDGAWWMAGGKGVPGGGGCVSCHHVAFALWSHREAQRAGIPFPEKPIADLEASALQFFTDKPSKIETVPSTELLLARKPGDGSDRWQPFLKELLASQEKDGSWTAGGQFPTQRRPVSESDAVATMWALIALEGAGNPDATRDAARKRALTWALHQQPGASNESLIVRLLVERRLGDATRAQSFLTQLLQRQRPDGGWSFLAAAPDAASEAFSTGEALYALTLAALPADHRAVRRATDYLLRRQQPDGTWKVPSELISKKGEHGKIDYVYRYWGTAWATIGLARTLPAAEATARR